MMAMHAKCEHLGGMAGWTNCETIDRSKGIFGSGWWLISDEEAEALRGGWIYFHERSTAPSTFVGRIIGLERRNDEGFAMLRIVRQPGIIAQRWRGGIAQQSPAHYRRIVEANYPHELAASPLS